VPAEPLRVALEHVVARMRETAKACPPGVTAGTLYLRVADELEVLARDTPPPVCAMCFELNQVVGL
jgi:hypothetical protein